MLRRTNAAIVGASGTTTAALTVPDGAYWKIMAFFFFITATATVGNRQILFRCTDALGTRSPRGIFVPALLTASQTQYVASSGGGLPAAYAFGGTKTQLWVPWDPIILPPASTIDVIDNNGVDPNDVFNLSIDYEEYALVPSKLEVGVIGEVAVRG